MQLIRHACAAFRNAFLSPGARLFGWRFARDYLRIAWHVAGSWGDTGPGEARLLGFRLPYPNQSHAFALLHEVFVHTPYPLRRPTPRPRIIDCGANIGFAVLFFKAAWPNASVLAIEAEPSTFAWLQRMVGINDLRDVETVHAAVAGHDGSIALYGGAHDVGGITTSISPQRGGSVVQTVPARRLSTFIDGPVDLIKLDIEGAEYEVVEELAASGRLACVRELAIECHALPDRPNARAELVARLEADGLRVSIAENTRSSDTCLLRADRMDR